MNTPLLLSATVRVIRDAARATKRRAELMIERVTAETVSNLVGLPGMVVKEYALEKQGEQEILHIFCEHEYEVAVCVHCGVVTNTIHEYKERCIRHLEVWGKTTFVHFPGRRFTCDICRKPFTEELSWLESQRRESMAYELQVYKQCRDTNQAAVAKRETLHPETVKTIFQRWAKRAEQQQQRPPVRCLGIDEISLRKGHKHFALILSDLERHCVIAVLAERSQEALTQWLAGLPVEERTAIGVVAMDLWGPYRGVVETKLSQAEIVADRFHVTKHLNEALAKIRRNLQAKANKADSEMLKGTRWLLVRHRTDLNAEEAAKLQAVLAAFPELRTAYLLKEKFMTIADKIQDRPRAERFLHAWLYEAQASGLPHLLKFTKTLQNWWNEFLNYFNEGFSSGLVEGLNNAIRGTIRRAFGFHLFENFRLHVMVEHAKLSIPLPPI